MIQIYLPYLILIMVACVVVGSFGGYLLRGVFGQGASVDTSQFNILLKAEQKKREEVQAELNLEILHGKLLEEALETMIQNEADRVHKTFTEIHKDHNKILVDPESNEKKIPERKIFKRRKLGAK